MALPSSVEGEIIGELKDWQNTDEISDLKEKRPHQESHKVVGRFINE